MSELLSAGCASISLVSTRKHKVWRRERFLSWEPRVRLRDYSFFSANTWDEIDEKTSEIVGAEGIAIPSVRVGICWTLEYLGYRRHSDHVLVPAFMGRCVLNAINRFALPVEIPTPQTRLVVVVHQYGFKQRLSEISAQCGSRSVLYVEDSPFGLFDKEDLGPGSLAKFIGFSKILPVLKGGFAISADCRLIEFIRAKRRSSSLWSLPLTLMMVILRHRRYSVSYSVLADLAYELYLESRGDNALMRGNFLRSLEKINDYGKTVADRIFRIQERLGSNVLLPDVRRLAYVVPFQADGKEEEVKTVFKRHRFDFTHYHVDVNRNLFHPEYRRFFLIPLNPLIPQESFEALVGELPSR